MNRTVRLLFFQLFLGVFMVSCAPKDDTYTVIVSLDAFRWDYPDLFETPGLDEIASEGMRAVLKPSYQ